jgi:hypothetical protein
MLQEYGSGLTEPGTTGRGDIKASIQPKENFREVYRQTIFAMIWWLLN